MSDYTPITGEMLYEQILKVRLAKPSYGIPDPAPWSDLMFEAREAYEGVAAYLAEREQMVKAEAWDEGHLSFYEAGVICPNPYREVRRRRHGVSTSRRNTEKETDD